MRPQHLVAGALTAADLLVEPVDHAASPAANNKQNYNAWCLISVRDEVVEYSNERCYSEILSSPLTGSIPNLCASFRSRTSWSRRNSGSDDPAVERCRKFSARSKSF